MLKQRKIVISGAACQWKTDFRPNRQRIWVNTSVRVCDACLYEIRASIILCENITIFTMT